MLIYDALMKDHEALKGLLNELVTLEADSARRHDLIEEIRDALIPHARAEESVFYNSIRAVDSAKSLALHGYQEHMAAEALLRTLQAQDKIDADWKATARKFKAAIEKHIVEEETEIFTVAQQLFTPEEARMMGEAFERVKPQVETEGFLKTTVDMVANLMPPRIAASLRTYNLNP